MQDTTTIRVIAYRVGSVPQVVDYSCELSEASESAGSSDNWVRGLLDGEISKHSYPDQLHKPELAVWRGDQQVVVAATDDEGGLRSIDAEWIDGVIDDLRLHREFFLPYRTLAASELADWIDRQPEAQWWSVDGDPLLTGRLSFPCPGDELSNDLRTIDRPLLLFDKSLRFEDGGQPATAGRIDELAADRVDEYGLLQLCWKSRPEHDWLLVDDDAIVENGRSVANSVNHSE